MTKRTCKRLTMAVLEVEPLQAILKEVAGPISDEMLVLTARGAIECYRHNPVDLDRIVDICRDHHRREMAYEVLAALGLIVKKEPQPEEAVPQ